MNTYALKIDSSMAQCELHITVLKHAISELGQCVDISKTIDLSKLDTWQVLRSLDQIAYRFQCYCLAFLERYWKILTIMRHLLKSLIG